MKKLVNKRIIQHQRMKGIINDSYFVDEDNYEEEVMIIYKRNPETGKYEYFDTKTARKQRVNTAAQIKQQYADEAFKKRKKDVDTFEKEYAKFIESLKKDYKIEELTEEVSPAVEPVVAETTETVKSDEPTKEVETETEIVEVPAVLDEVVKELPVKKTRKKKKEE